MEKVINKNEELDFLLKEIKAKHLSQTKSTNFVIIISMIILGLFFLYSGITASNEREKLERVIIELTLKNQELTTHLNETKNNYDNRFLNASNELSNVEQRLSSASEKLNAQQAEELFDNAYELRQRIEALEIYNQGVTHLQDKLNTINSRIDALETDQRTSH